MQIPFEALWRREYALRTAVFIDGEAYFRAFRQAVLEARHAVYLLGWDFNSRIALVRDRPADGYPAELLPFLNAVARERPALRIYLLDWDYALVYAGERETIPVMRFDWATEPGIEFALDGELPFGASHHQKVVVVDDAVAFIGGFDLTGARWDTAAHLADDPRRNDPVASTYGPFHDVQAAVSGPAAAALGDLARLRWARATGRKLAPPPPRAPFWPPGWPVDFTPRFVGLARTMPAHGRHAAVKEIERLHLEVIGRARRYLYFENQYFTSWLVAEALAARLDEPRGPEVVLMLPWVQSGWLEQTTMGLLRLRGLAHLRRQDRHGRLRVLAPFSGDRPVNLHAKIFAADDAVLKIGSSNLTNRSMVFDSEIDLVVTGRGVAPLVRRLVAHHMGEDPAALRGATPGAWLARARQGCVRPLREEIPAWFEPLAATWSLLDPETPSGYAALIPGRAEGVETSPPAAAAVLSTGVALGALALRVASKRNGAFRDLFLPRRRGDRWGAAGGAAAAWVLPLPLSVLASASLGMRPVRAAAFHGALNAAAYAFGRSMRRERARRIGRGGAGRRLPWLVRGDLRAVAAMRLFSGVPAMREGMLSGAGRVRAHRYLAASLAVAGAAAAVGAAWQRAAPEARP